MSSLQQLPGKGQYRGISLRELPFMRIAKDQRKRFFELNVKSVKTYAEACREGGRIAAVFMSWLAENPAEGYGNALGFMAAAFDYEDTENSSGLWVGFFASIGRQLAVRAGKIDALAIQEREEQIVAALLAKSYDKGVVA